MGCSSSIAHSFPRGPWLPDDVHHPANQSRPDEVKGAHRRYHLGDMMRAVEANQAMRLTTLMAAGVLPDRPGEKDVRGHGPLLSAAWLNRDALIPVLHGVGSAHLERRVGGEPGGRTALLVACAAERLQWMPEPKWHEVTSSTIIRAGVEKSTEDLGKLQVGERILVLEQRADAKGGMRCKFEHGGLTGWVSVVSGAGVELLRELQPDSGGVLRIADRTGGEEDEDVEDPALRALRLAHEGQEEEEAELGPGEWAQTPEDVVLATLEVLLEVGCDVRARSGDGRTALHYVAANGFLSLLPPLLAAGCPLECRMRSGFEHHSLGHNEAKHPSFDGFDGATALMLAAQLGDERMVAALMAAGCDVKARENAQGFGMPILTATAMREELSEVRRHTVLSTLLSGDADADASGRDITGQRGNADIHALDERGYTALHAAALRGRSTLVPLLVSCGSQLDGRDGEGRTALMLASMGPAHGCGVEMPNQLQRVLLHEVVVEDDEHVEHWMAEEARYFATVYRLLVEGADCRAAVDAGAMYGNPDVHHGQHETSMGSSARYTTQADGQAALAFAKASGCQTIVVGLAHWDMWGSISATK